MAEETFVLEIKAITLGSGGLGKVRFSFTVPETHDYVTIDMPYYSETGIDAGVKDAAGQLALLADVLAEQARALAE